MSEPIFTSIPKSRDYPGMSKCEHNGKHYAMLGGTDDQLREYVESLQEKETGHDQGR